MIQSLLQNPKRLDKYNVTVRNRYQALNNQLENLTATKDYAIFRHSAYPVGKIANRQSEGVRFC